MTQQELQAYMTENNLNVRSMAVLTESSTSAVYMWLRGERGFPKVKEGLLNRKVHGTGKVLVKHLGMDWSVR